LLTDRDEMSNLHRCFLPIVGSFGQAVFGARALKIGITCLFYTLQVGIHILKFFLANLAKVNMSFCHHLVSVVSSIYFSFFRNQQIRKKNCLWRPCLLTDRDKISNLHRGHSIDDSYQVLVHLVKRFQRRFIR
jgi:hypothetical protein